MFPLFLSFRKLQGFQGLCARNWGAETKHVFLIINHNITFMFSVFWFSPISFLGGASVCVNKLVLTKVTQKEPQVIFLIGTSGHVLRNSFKDSLSFV